MSNHRVARSPRRGSGGHAHVPVLEDADGFVYGEHGHVGVPTDPHLGVRATRCGTLRWVFATGFWK